MGAGKFRDKIKEKYFQKWKALKEEKKKIKEKENKLVDEMIKNKVV